MGLLPLLMLLRGKRTYLLSLGFTAYAVFGWYAGSMTADQAINVIQTSGLGATLRAAIGGATS